jgi:hypothetical protein
MLKPELAKFKLNNLLYLPVAAWARFTKLSESRRRQACKPGPA